MTDEQKAVLAFIRAALEDGISEKAAHAFAHFVTTVYSQPDADGRLPTEFSKQLFELQSRMHPAPPPVRRFYIHD